MQFGIGLIGRGWTVEGQLERVRADTRTPRKNFEHRVHMYVAKVAAMTIFAEPPTAPDLSDDGIVALCGPCVSPVRPSEAPLVRQAFIREYGDMKAVLF